MSGFADIIVICQTGDDKYTLEKRGMWLPDPGRTIAYTFDILANTTVLGFIIKDPNTKEQVDGGPAQHFVSPGTYTVQMTGDTFFPTKREKAMRHANRRDSAQFFRKEKLRTRGHVLPSR